MKNIQQSRGFTLVEMMVVIAIIGILAAIGMPLYNGHTEKGELADAKRAATNLRQSFESVRLERPRAFQKPNDFKQEYQRAYQGSVHADILKKYNFTVQYWPDAAKPQGFGLTITPKKKSRKYGLKMEVSGDVLRCEYKGSSLVIPTCEKF